MSACEFCRVVGEVTPKSSIRCGYRWGGVLVDQPRAVQVRISGDFAHLHGDIQPNTSLAIELIEIIWKLSFPQRLAIQTKLSFGLPGG